jgi:hypothetical protein
MVSRLLIWLNFLASFQTQAILRGFLDWIRQFLETDAYEIADGLYEPLDMFKKIVVGSIIRVLCLLSHKKILSASIFYRFLKDAIRMCPENMYLYFLASKWHDYTATDIVRRGYEKALR